MNLFWICVAENENVNMHARLPEWNCVVQYAECVANRNSPCLGWVKRSHLEQRLGKSKRSKENCGGKTEGASERKRGKGGKLDPKTLPGVLYQTRGLALFTDHKLCPERSNCHLVICYVSKQLPKMLFHFITNSVPFKTQNRIFTIQIIHKYINFFVTEINKSISLCLYTQNDALL